MDTHVGRQPTLCSCVYASSMCMRFVNGEVRKVLMDVAWREVKGGWKKEAQGHPKLEMVGNLMEQECEGW